MNFRGTDLQTVIAPATKLCPRQRDNSLLYCSWNYGPLWVGSTLSFSHRVGLGDGLELAHFRQSVMSRTLALEARISEVVEFCLITNLHHARRLEFQGET